jgi:hypothetical protein
MRKLNVVQIVLGLSLSFGVMAQQRLPSDEYEVYRADKERIEREYKADKERCESFDGNAEDICVAEAEGKQEVAKAELEARYKPSGENYYQAQVAKAKANYRVAKERCDDQSGNVKDVCLKEAKAAEAAAIADAKREDYESRNPDPIREGF